LFRAVFVVGGGGRAAKQMRQMESQVRAEKRLKNG
jgi:hypothetical protein